MATRRVIESQPEQTSPSIEVQQSPSAPKEQGPTSSPQSSPVKKEELTQKPPKVSTHPARPKNEGQTVSKSIESGPVNKSVPKQIVAPKADPKASKVQAQVKQHTKQATPQPAFGVNKRAAIPVPKKREVLKKAQHKPKLKTDSSHKRQEAQDDEQDMASWPLIAMGTIVLIIILGMVWATWGGQQVNPSSNASTQGSDRFGYDPSKIQTFNDIYNEMKLLDEKYQTDLHEERLGKDMIPPKFIDGYVERIDALSGAVNASGSNETDVMVSFIEARRRMLLSQDYFQQALKFGTKGVVTTVFNCADVPTVLEATRLYNESFEIGRLAIPRLDFVLRKSEDARDTLGLNTQKMRWFVTTFGDIKHLIDTNLWLVDQLCVKRQSLNKSQSIDVQEAREDFEQDFPGAVVP